MTPKRVEVLGVPVDCINMTEAVEFVEQMISSEGSKTVISVNPEKVIKAQQDPQLLTFLQQARLLIPDGIGLVAAVKILGLGQLERVPGSELMPATCEVAAKKGYSIFLFGATQDVNYQAKKQLLLRYHGLKIAGQQDGYVKEEDMDDIVDQINASGAQILFIALGSPRQELWMEKYLPRLNVKVCQGVGGTFDVIAGKVKRAPLAFRKIHLEWFYRLITQPSRILRQTSLPKFVIQVIQVRFGWKR